MKCKECELDFESARKLSKHFRDKHKLSTVEYYQKYQLVPGEGKCKECNGPTLFTGLTGGYKQYCTVHRGIAMSNFRAKLRNDTDKFRDFTLKVKENQSRIWADRVKSGEDGLIRERIGKTNKSNNLKLTAAERKDKYGWLSKLPDAEQALWKTEVMFQTGMHKWWATATLAEIQTVVNRRVATMIAASESLVAAANLDPTNYARYAQAVWHFTTYSYIKYKNEIDPDGKRGKDWHLDHIYSVKAGFVNGVEPWVIGNKQNLRILTMTENLTKNARCDITLEDLINKVING